MRGREKIPDVKEKPDNAWIVEAGWRKQDEAVWGENVQPFIAKICNMENAEQEHALDESIANFLEWRVVPGESSEKTVRIGVKSAQLRRPI